MSQFPSSSLSNTPFIQHLAESKCILCKKVDMQAPRPCDLQNGSPCVACLKHNKLEAIISASVNALQVLLLEHNQMRRIANIENPPFMGPTMIPKHPRGGRDCAPCQTHEALVYNQLYSLCLSTGEPCRACSACILENKMQQMLEFLKASFRESLLMPKQINAYHDPFTHKFPPEISSMIFKYTVPDLWETQQRDQWVSSSQRSAPLTLGAVSQRWRAISQGTPKLWTDVHLNVLLLYKIHYSSWSPMSEHNQVKLEIFRQWLSRAGIHPLSLHITMLPKYTEKLNAGGFARQIRREEIDREFGPFIEVINSHAHRWQNLSVRSVDAVLLSLGRSYEDAPRLRTLMLSSLDGRQGSDPEEYVADDNADRFSLTIGTPRPFYFCIENHKFKHVNINWNSGVTHISAKNIRMRACIKTLSFAPQVVECRINHFFCSPRLVTPEPIAHLSLKHLYVHDSALQGLNFLEEITLPALTHLSLRLGPLQLSDCHVLVDFVKRSSCILTNFELSSNGFGKEHMDSLIYLLCCLPSTEYLVLRRMDFHPEDLLRLLAITAVTVDSDTASSDTASDNDNEKEERPSFLPKLQHFSYSLSIAQLQKEIPWHLLPNVFGPLSGNNRRPLKSIKVDNEWRLDDDTQTFLEDADEIDEDVVRRLIDVVDAGFSLQLPVETRKEDLMYILGKLDI